jgi:hypothetical protein
VDERRRYEKRAMGRVILGGKEVILSMHKEEVLELVRQLPEEVDVEEVIYRLYLREKLAAAEADIAAGLTLSPEEVREQARTWRQ